MEIVIALIFHAIDLISGFTAAWKEKNIQSAKMRDGVFKKIGFIVCYAVAWLFDNYGHEIGFKLEINILPIIVAYAVGIEIMSIFENVHRINPDLLPDKLMEKFGIGGEKSGNIRKRD